MNHNFLKNWFTVLMFVFMPLVLLAQTIDIKGDVVDVNGEPIPGASVSVSGTNQAVVTDYNGNFTLPNVKSGSTIIASFVGMNPTEAKAKPEMHIVLQERSELLDEVVVVAFGKQKREAFTGSATVVQSKDITLRQANNPIEALEGRVPGLTMLQSNNPASENTINIRGLSSINASTTPLIIVDGQPYNGALRDINPADVDNISVLKDAASNALYGARGANGVIMITTKTPQKGKTKVTLDMKWGANTDALIDYDIIDNPAEYYEAHYQALYNYNHRALGLSAAESYLNANTTMMGTDSEAGGLGYIIYAVPEGQVLVGSNGRLNPDAVLGNRVFNNGRWFTLYPDNWRENGLRTGFRQEYNLNLSGGNENYSTYFSLGYLDNEGISYGSDLQRYSARFKTDYQAYPWAKVGANASYSRSDYNNMNNAFSCVHNIAPIYPLFYRDEFGHVMTDSHGPMYDYGDGTLGFVRGVNEKNSNSIQSDRLDVSKVTSNSFGISGYANIDFLKDFRLTINGNVHIYEYRSDTAYNPYYGYYQSVGGNTSSSQYRRVSTNFQQLLNWNHQFGRNNLEILLGHEYSRNKTGSISGSKNQIAIFEENIELSGAIINGSMSGSTSMYNVEGYFSRLQYDYDSRIFASASFRRDGSSRFHPKHRWGNFWSVGGAWIISKEDWFPKTPMINMLKFKASYGQQGNDGLGSSYYWTDYYDIQNSNDNVAYTFKWKGNPDITWETNGNFNSGFEFDLFNSRLNGSAEYYYRKTGDMLYFKPVPSSLGYGGYYDNIGDMVNDGIEVTLNGGIIRSRNINWGVNLNFAWEKNHISYLPPASKGLVVDGHDGYQGGYYFYGEGLPMYTWYIPVYTGPNDKGEPTWQLEKNGEITTTTSYDQATNYVCGTALPDMYGGFGTTLQVYGFDLTANFTFTIGGKKLDNGYLSLMGSPYGSNIGQNIHRDALQGWSEANPDGWIPRWQYNDTQNNLTSDFFLIDGSQLTFKTCQVGYTIPKNITSKLMAQSVRLYFSVDNVWYWTKRKGFDPRGGRTTYNGTGYSPMRTFVGGINFVF